MEVFFCLPGLHINENELLLSSTDFGQTKILNKILRYGTSKCLFQQHSQLLSYYLLKDNLKKTILGDLDLPQDTIAFFASPISQRIELHSVAIGGGNRILQITLAEAHCFCADLNQLFVEDGWQFHVYRPDLWLVTVPYFKKWQADVIWDILGQIGPETKISGEDGQEILKFQTEIQMLLFNHKINVLRRKNAQIEVNGLWLWQDLVGLSSFDLAETVYAGDMDWLPKSAPYHFIEGNSWQELSLAIKPKTKRVVLYYEDMIFASLLADYYTQKETLYELEHLFLEPMYQDLCRGKIRELHLISHGGSLGDMLIKSTSHKHFWKIKKTYQGKW